MFAIVGDNRASVCNREIKHLVVGNAAPAISGIPRREHIMPECAQMFDDTKGVILVRVKRRHHTDL